MDELKSGQQRTRVIMSHSSHPATLDPGKDGGRRVQEQGNRGEGGGCGSASVQQKG